MYRQVRLGHDLEARFREGIDGDVHRAFGGILRRHHSVVRASGLYCGEDIGYCPLGDELDARAELVPGRLMREGAGRAKVSDAALLLQAMARRNDLAPYRPQTLRGHRPVRCLQDIRIDVFLPPGIEHGLVIARLELADLEHGGRPLLEESSDLPIDLVDLCTQCCQ